MVNNGPTTEEIDMLKCERCKHEWHPRTERKPKWCPKCKTDAWEKPLTPYWAHVRKVNKERKEAREAANE